MTAYIINENVTSDEIGALNAATGSSYVADIWPDETANVPPNITVAVLIVRSENTRLEETRAMAVISLGIRIVCIFIEPLQEISDLVKNYCSSKVAVGSAGLIDALKGNDGIQQDKEGKHAPKNPQKPHNC